MSQKRSPGSSHPPIPWPRAAYDTKKRSGGVGMPPPPPPLPELMEELVEEVLLRFPPDDPGSLVRAALVCKLWCRLVSGRAFRRRFREFHRGAVSGTWLRRNFRKFYRSAAPLLSVIYTGNCKLKHDGDTPRNTDPSLKPVRIMPLPMPYRVASARHGRVVLYRYNIYWVDHWHHATIVYSVWNPVTNEQQDLPELPWSTWHSYSVAVVCAATAGGNCDHLDCHRGPFLVVAMEFQSNVMNLSVYSSEAGAWSHLPGFELPIPIHLAFFKCAPSGAVLVGSALYLLAPLYNEILKYDLGTRELSVIPLPSKIGLHKGLKRSIVLTEDDGEIGFRVNHEIYLPTRELSVIPLPSKNRPLKRSDVLTDDDAGEIGFVANKKYKLNVSSALGTTTTLADETASEANTRMAQEPTLRPRRARKPNSFVSGPEWM